MTLPLALSGILLALNVASGAPAYARTLATIDGETVTEESLMRAADTLGQRSQMMLGDPALRRQYLDHVIDSRLMAKAAETSGITNSPQYKDLLAEAQTQILAKLYAETYIDKHLTDAELQSFFATAPGRYSNQEIHVAHIVVKDEGKAKSLLIQLKNGADFATLAKEQSQGPSAPHGGDLGFIGRGRMVKEFEDAMFNTPKGTVYPQPIKTPFGFHLVKVIETKGDANVAYADVADKVRLNYTEELRERMVKELRGKAQVKVDEEAVRTFAPPPKS